MKKVSIVIPVYNIEQYLPRCLDSVISQTYTNLEIILVDDGSTDSSGRICDEYAEKDKRIVVIHKCNSGVSATRNEGVNQSTGDYIVFIDGDDYVSYQMVEKLYGAIEKKNTPMSCCAFFQDKDGAIEELFCDYPGEIIEADEMSSNFFSESFIKNIMYPPWNKMFRADLVKRIPFRIDLRIGEDLLFCFQVVAEAGAMAVVPEPLYYYRIRQNSAMRELFSPKRLDYISAGEEIVAICEKKYPDASAKARAWLYQHTLVLLRNILLLPDQSEYAEYIREKKDYIRNNRSCLKHLPPKRKLDYLGVLYCPAYFKLIAKLRRRKK